MGLMVFDLDGTLMNSHPAIVASFQHAHRAHDLAPSSDDAITALIGLPLELMADRLTPGATADTRGSVIATFCDVYAAYERELGALFEGAVPLLEQLAAVGHTVAIATSKSQRGLDRILRETALGGVVTIGASHDTVDRGKPAPDMLRWVMEQAGATPDQTRMVGDTEYDVCMAVEASTRAIGVTWGAHDRARLTEAGAATVVDHMHDLAALLSAG